MKRYRDAARRLTMTIDEIAAATLAEAREYYQDGGRYIYEGRAYTLRRYIDRDAHGNAVEVAQFVGERLATIEGVTSTATHFILKKYKEKHLVFRRPEPQEREFVFS